MVVLLAVVALTWPAAAHPGTVIVGDAGGAMWRALWTQDRFHQALLSGHLPAATTTGLGFPVETVVVSPSPATDAVAAALRFLLSPVAAFDALLAGLIVVGAVGAGAVARASGARGSAIVLAGTVFGLSPYFLTAALASASPDAASGALVPWLVLALTRGVHRPGPWPAVASVAAFLVLILCDLNLYVLLPILLPVIVVPELFLGGTRRSWWWIGAVVLLTGVATWIATTPALELLRQAGGLGPPTALQPTGEAGPEPESLHAVATLAGVVRPGTLVIHEGIERSLLAVYAGWVALGLALVGAGVGRMRWVALGIAALALSLGPWMPVDATSLRAAPVGWWTLLWHAWPASRWVDLPVRAMPVALLALAVLAAAGLERVRAAAGESRWAGVIGPIAIIAVLVDLSLSPSLPLPLPTTQQEVPASVAFLESQPEAGAVLDWPQRIGQREFQTWVYLQALHGRPVPWDFSQGPGASGIEANGLVASLDQIAEGHSPPGENQGVRGAWILHQQGVRWLVVHGALLDPATRSAVRKWLEARLQVVAELPGDVVVFDTRP